VTKEDSERKKDYSNLHLPKPTLRIPIKSVESIEQNNKLSVKEVIVKGHKDLIKKYKTKAKNIWGGMKIVVDKIKRN